MNQKLYRIAFIVVPPQQRRKEVVAREKLIFTTELIEEIIKRVIH